MSELRSQHLLLVEDDGVSAAFLREALSALPAQIDVASNLAAASQHTASTTYALWLVDANLPDGHSAPWLQAERKLGRSTLALALTAETDRHRLDALIAAGFAEVLPKPLPVALLLATVRRWLGSEPAHRPISSEHKVPVWDEQQALSALGGDENAIRALRGLFLAELPDQHAYLLAAVADGQTEAALAVLHKLQASTAFVGAARLALACRTLKLAISDHSVLAAFSEAVSDLLNE